MRVNSRSCVVLAPRYNHMKKFVALLIIVIAAVSALSLWLQPTDKKTELIRGLPWQIERLPGGGSKVFGLTLGLSTIADARRRFGGDMEIAILANAGEMGSLEAYYNKVTAGVLTGQLVLGVTASPAVIARLKTHASKIQLTATGGRQYRLASDDLPAAYRLPINTITFIPSANIDLALALKRFGEPAERVRTDPAVLHLLYPDKGLDLILNDRGKEILQYVAPRHFERLRAPLHP